MPDRKIISTPNAPEAIGTYSQAVRVDKQVYISGQIPLHPQTMQKIDGTVKDQVHQVFKNLSAVAESAGGGLDDCVKLTVYLTDLGNFTLINEVMSEYFSIPYPARAAVEVSALPKEVDVEIDAIMYLQS
ncbi:MAG: RidA family protein [Pseudomonadales bacterium]|nr:RidA family protein [Pseudomonadales bacterium]